MRWVKRYTSITAAILAGSLAAGCASTPEQAARNGRAAEAAQDAAETRVSSGGAEGDAAVAPSLVVDARDPAPGSAVTCRDLLKQGSNVIITQCMTLDDWKMFERRQALEAAEIVRTLQGGAYR